MSSSRYIEIPLATLWISHDTCTRCSCKLNGRLTCEFLRSTCIRPCLVHKTRGTAVLYYFPSDSQWITPLNKICRSCTCSNGQRTCINCNPILRININVNRALKNRNEKQSPIGEYSLLPSKPKLVKIIPCLIQINTSSHQLILPGQQTWIENHCYLCSKYSGQLIMC